MNQQKFNQHKVLKRFMKGLVNPLTIKLLINLMRVINSMLQIYNHF